MVKRLGNLALGLLAFSLLWTGCSSRDGTNADPRETLKEYVSKSFAVSRLSDRMDLQAYLTGEVRARFSAWSDAQFEEAFVNSKRKFERLRIREVKKDSPKSVSITYELTYRDNDGGREVTQKKISKLVDEGGRWKIKEVKNLRELVEFKNELSLP